MMGVMTLALSVFSIVPFAICLAKRFAVARVITHLVDEYSSTDGSSSGGGIDTDIGSVNFWGTVNDALRDDVSNLPPPDDDKVAWLAYTMLIFFIVSLCLLTLYAIWYVCTIKKTLICVGKVASSRVAAGASTRNPSYAY